MAPPSAFGELNLSIIGLASEYPPHDLPPNALDTIANKFYPPSEAMTKVLKVNAYTGIETRSSIGTPDHPLVNQKDAPSIEEVHKVFMSDGVPLAIRAARKAIDEAKIDLESITHIVSTTCTDSANPGFDHFVAKGLGITHQPEKVLLHGVGCSGGLATLRTGANLALGHKARGLPARVLCIALEVSTTFVRSELNSIHEEQLMRIGSCLFSDCASAVVLSNGLGGPVDPIYSLLGWDHRIIPDTESDLGFDVHPLGWKVILTPSVPKVAAEVVKPAFNDLLAQLPALPADYQKPTDFDWAMHPGGSTILAGVERAMGYSDMHQRASYMTYMQHGNSSSATIFSVMDRLRTKEMDSMSPGGRIREYVVGCAFGPGIAVEICMMKRNLEHGKKVIALQTPPETDSESGGDIGDGDESVTESLDEALGHDDRKFVQDALEQLDLD